MHQNDAATPGPPEELLAVAEDLVASATGDEQVEVVLARGASTGVKVHGAEVESFTSAGSAEAGVRVIREGRLGFASCGTLDAAVLAETLREARDNCRFAEPDDHNGLARPDGVEAVVHDTWSDDVLLLTADDRIDAALQLEAMALGSDPRVSAARSTVHSAGWSQSALVASSGIRVTEAETYASISTQPIAREGEETQIGWSVDAARGPGDLDPAKVAHEAVERATKLLGAGRPTTGRMPVLLDARLSVTLLSLVAGMLSGEAVAKGRSPFAERLGETVASPLLDLSDDPTRTDSPGARSFDGEGLACRPNPLLRAGRLETFLYDSLSARRAGRRSTASAVRSVRGLPSPGAQLLVVEPGPHELDAIRSGVELGIAVESFSGLHSGVNPVSGDFSVGADGVMIRNGELAEPVKELTLASTLQRLLLEVVAVGSDFEWLPGGSGGASMLIDEVSVAGA